MIEEVSKMTPHQRYLADAMIEGMRAKLRTMAAVIDGAIHTCHGAWLSGSGGHIVWEFECDADPTWASDGVAPFLFCDAHVPRINGELHPAFAGAVRFADYLDSGEGPVGVIGAAPKGELDQLDADIAAQADEVRETDREWSVVDGDGLCDDDD